MTLHAHFFGCSFTAGDELVDDRWFPWKFTETHTPESYFHKRKNTLKDNVLSREYLRQNKLAAYPALASKHKSDLVTYNHANLGKSHRHNVVDVVQLLVANTEPIDHVFFQIVPSSRNFDYLEGIGPCSFQDANPIPAVARYVKEKQKIMFPWARACHDLFDIIMLDKMLKTQGINFTLLGLLNEFRYLIDDLENAKPHVDNLGIMIDYLLNEIDLIEFKKEPEFLSLLSERMLLGGHLDRVLHEYIARAVSKHIKSKSIK